MDEIHYATVMIREALVALPKIVDGTYVADIPNILLQSANTIHIYVVTHTANGERTIDDTTLGVTRRKKPSDYVYTETEVMSYQDLERRVTELEQSGGGGGILKETDPTVPDWAKKPEKPTYTAEEVGALPEDTEIPDLTDLENKVCELERGANERKWIKVADVITEEDVHSINFTELPENIRDIRIFLRTKYVEETGYNYFHIFANAHSFIGNAHIRDYICYYNCRLEIMEDGTGLCLYGGTNLLSSNPVVLPATRGSSQEYIRDDLNQIYQIGVAHSAASGLLAKGTMLKIWVRGG